MWYELFSHKDIHKISWNSPNRCDKSQIDHLLINGKWRRSLKDVRVRRLLHLASPYYPDEFYFVIDSIILPPPPSNPCYFG